MILNSPKINNILKQNFLPILSELSIIFILLFTLNNYIEYQEETILADGIGYYDYLPSTFIHGDIFRKGKTISDNPELYKRILDKGVYNLYNDSSLLVDKYPIGTAVLEFPFFFYAYLTTELDGNANDGYQKQFKKSIFYSSVFYLFLSLFFIRLSLKLLGIKNAIIWFIQLLIVLATPVTHYVNTDASFSHIYSLFAISVFMFYSIKYFQTYRLKYFLLTCLSIGLIILIRQINVVIVLSLPFLALNWQSFIKGVKLVFTKYVYLFYGIGIIILVLSIQMIFWYFQTGDFIVYSYNDEGFNFLSPEFYNILFSYKKGLFVYTPVLFTVFFVTILWGGLKKEYYLLFSWLFFFIIITYIFSSWHSWFYGCSFGLRAYVEFLGVLLIPFAISLNYLSTKYSLSIIFVCLFAIPVNIIQTYQYKNYMLHWLDMDKQMYWNVFLETDQRFHGYFWLKQINENNYESIKKLELNDIIVEDSSYVNLLTVDSSELEFFRKANIIQVSFISKFEKTNDTKIILAIDNEDHTSNYYWHGPYLFHFATHNIDQWQRGYCNFEVPVIDDTKTTFHLGIQTNNEFAVLKNIEINLLKKK